ncbi:unnamed protein product, partial [Meganyctiphanes norvegica]
MGQIVLLVMLQLTTALAKLPGKNMMYMGRTGELPVFKDCGGTINDVPSGIVDYPGDGLNYPNKARCVCYRIRAPLENVTGSPLQKNFADSPQDAEIVKNGEA